jgi:hypothetical protein
MARKTESGLIVPDETTSEIIALAPKTKVPLFVIVKELVESISPLTNNVPALIVVAPV